MCLMIGEEKPFEKCGISLIYLNISGSLLHVAFGVNNKMIWLTDSLTIYPETY